MPAKTLHDRMKRGRRVSWDEMRAVVVALSLDDEVWHPRWEIADQNPRQRRSEPEPLRIVDSTPQDSRPNAALVADLPLDSGTFAGRDQEVADLLHLLTADWSATSTSVVSVVGMAGVGKTRLAVHVAHGLRSKYDEIQLYLDLRGHSEHDPPVEPASALDVFLRRLGVPAEQVPASLEERAARFRSCLQGRRAVLVLDNVASEAQVRPLLAASPTSCVILTSRRRLSGLDEARAMELDVMEPEDSVGLLAGLIGEERVAAESDQARALAVQCGGLPLALTLVGCRLRARPTWRLARMRARLSEEGDRLAELSVRDRAVRAAFGLSYANLPPQHRRVFRLLATHPGRDFSALSTAALAGTSPGTAESILEDLLDESLLEQRTEGRYAFHDLVRLFAAERLQAEEPPAAVKQAMSRLLNWYLRAADAADRVLVPHRRHVLPDHDGDADPALPRFESYAQALQWCDIEQPALAAAVALAAAQREYVVAWQLPTALFGFYRLKHSWQDWLHQQLIGLEAARELGDEYAEAWIMNAIGIISVSLKHHDEAHRWFERALEVRRRCGDREGESHTLNNLGELCRRTGQFDRAIGFYELDQQVCQELGDEYGECISLNNLGKAQLAVERTQQAKRSQEAALLLCRDLGDRHSEAEILDDLGHVYRRLDRHDLAMEHYTLAVAAYRRVGSDLAAAETLANAADLLHEIGRCTDACQYARDALAVLDGPPPIDASELRARVRHQLESFS